MAHRRGGVARTGDSGDERRRGWARWNDHEAALPTVVVEGAGVAGDDDGEQHGGGRSSGVHGNMAGACKRTN